MSIDVKVEEWLRKMGYSGKIPSDLPKICNPSTAFIWEQLITNVRPRQEVEHIRKNIIVNRLLQKSLNEQGQFSYPIKEIQVYSQAKTLRDKEKLLERQIEEKKVQLDDILKDNKITYSKIDSLKAKIRENQLRSYLLEKKATTIEERLHDAKESLTLVRNLTPVEMDNTSNEEITKTLEICASKLHKLTQEVPVPKPNKTTHTTSTKRKKTPKVHWQPASVLMDILPSCIKTKDPQSKITINRNLKFTDDENKENECKPRESLGLLPADSLNISDDFDDYFLKGDSTFTNSLSESFIYSKVKPQFDIVEKLTGNTHVQEVLKDLLHTQNRFLIWKHCKNTIDGVSRDVQNLLMDYKKLIRHDTPISQNDLTELYFAHTVEELKKEVFKITLEKKKESFMKLQEGILYQLSKKRNEDELKELFELKIQHCFYTGVNNFLHEERKSMKKLPPENETDLISFKVRQAEEETVSKIDWMQNLTSNICHVKSRVKKISEETSSCVKKLNLYTRNWAESVSTEANSQEIELFKTFPLEFNRKGYRDMSNTTVPPFVHLKQNDFDALTELIDVPFSPPESVILKIIQMKETQKSLEALPPMEVPNVKACRTLGELDRKEKEYIDGVTNKLNSIINSSGVKEVLGAPVSVKKLGDIWLEMPFRNYISKKRLVDGHDYEFYEAQFNELFPK